MRDEVATNKKYNKIYYIFPAMYVLMIYLMWFGILGSIFKERTAFDPKYVLIIIGLLFIANIIVPIIFAKRVDRTVLLNGAMIVKCGLIPFYIMGGGLIALVLMTTFTPIPFMIFLAPGLAFMLGTIGWLIMAFSSPYSIAYFITAAKQNRCKTYMAVIMSILQFIFTLDIISLFCMSLIERKWVKLITTISVILFIAAVIVVMSIVVIIGAIILPNM